MSSGVSALAPVRSRIARRGAVGEAVCALLVSRLVIWVVGVVAVSVVGPTVVASAHLNHLHLATPFSSDLANVLVAPAARGDSVWYLQIAQGGYARPGSAAFYPLYPLVVAGLGGLFGGGTGDYLVAGIAISIASALGALVLLYRLTELDFDANVARASVWVTALLPASIFLSAVYTEGLFLLLSVGSIYAARTERWWLAGLVGALAAATRNSGALLLIPLVVMYLYGPRAGGLRSAITDGLRPRYRVRRDMLWIALVPVGVLAYMTYLGISSGHPFASFTAEADWHRTFSPFGGVLPGIWLGLKAVVHIVQYLSWGGHVPPSAIHAALPMVYLLTGVALLWWARTKLPAAYSLYALAVLTLSVSAPSAGEPLRSLPRFTLVLFPIWIALALFVTGRRWYRPLLIVMVPMLAIWTYWFVTWFYDA